MSAVTLWIMCVVIVVCLAGWLLAVFIGARTPFHKPDHQEPLRGRVQGGVHQGGGRSVAPHRDEPVELNEDPDQARPHRGTSPMDLLCVRLRFADIGER